jgi:hypothetical protein
LPLDCGKVHGKFLEGYGDQPGAILVGPKGKALSKGWLRIESEEGHAFRPGFGHNFCSGSVRQNPSGIDDEEPCGDALGFEHVVGGHKDGFTLLPQG